MLLVYLCRFSQPPSAEVPQQLMLNSYQQFEDIEPAAELLRKQTAEAKTHSFSRGWFDWELLLRRYIGPQRAEAVVRLFSGGRFRSVSRFGSQRGR